MKALRRQKGRVHGGAMMVWLFFANLFDPKRVVAIEQIETDRRIGNPVIRDAATPAAPPSD
ncbi:hypothetical protein ACLB0R_07715 [Sphingomonas sp. GlSt437]|uniref:hypothetical protein n=1 Tax=Sphingomonas sp. GlSt437 TaxID=3389970 RepID=UPI003A8BB936